jgi:hypothetical protein
MLPDNAPETRGSRKIAESFRVGLQLASLLPSSSKPYTYALKNAACKDAGYAVAIRQEGDEERACALLEIPRGGGSASLEWQDFCGLQRGERFLRDDELRGTHRNIFGGGTAWAKD